MIRIAKKFDLDRMKFITSRVYLSIGSSASKSSMLQTAPRIATCAKQIRLNFQVLTAFERVTEQYSDLGVRFSDAIALEPSNPAFLPKTGCFVLMPLGHEMILTASFDSPTSWVGGEVCGTGSVILTAFDQTGKILAQVTTAASQGKGSCSKQQLELNRSGIAKVMFHSSEPFILKDFYFQGPITSNAQSY